MKLEDYECDGCRNDGFVHTGCGDCPHNNERIAEYYRKYGRNYDDDNDRPSRRGLSRRGLIFY